MMELEGKTALITGSSRGIGRAIALELAGLGANVVINYFRKRSAAEGTVAEILSLGVKAISIRADVGKSDRISFLFEEAYEVFGGIDILVCNAASGVFRSAMEVDRRAWDWTMNINAQSVLWCAQNAVPMMEKRGWGRIVTISSIGTFRMLPLYSLTGISKAAVEALTRYMAVELAPKGITVNAVAPGAVHTEEWDLYPTGQGDKILSEICRRTPKQALVTPNDVAKTVGFLCGDGADAIVGQTIVVDGGFTLAL